MPKISALPPMTTADAADEAPIVDTSASTTKKWTLTLLKTYLQSLAGWIATAMLADDSVTASKIDWASTGANAGIWWEELGRTTLGSAGATITVNSLPARKYLRILIYMPTNGSAVTGSLTFNNDTAANYAMQNSTNGAADGSLTSQSSMVMAVDSTSIMRFAELEVINVTAQQKIIIGHTVTATTSAAVGFNRRELQGVWVNTSAQISRVDVITGTANNFGVGAEVIVLGHN